jgi:beta-galactosidase
MTNPKIATNRPFRLFWLCLLAGGFALHLRAQAPLPPEIEDPQCLGLNKEPFHATLMPYGSLKEALTARRSDSTFCRSLNGPWKFNWVPHPAQRPVDFYKPEFDASGWKEIPVPSNWQLLGYGTPFYRNNGYTFQKDWPRVLAEPPKNYTSYVERDPVGSYRRKFEVPAGWRGRRIFLTFDGVDSAFFLWINGQKAGFSVNSRNAAEFDITKFLKAGKNLLAAEVYTYSAGSYIEDQDMWRLSGIFRNVTLWSSPPEHIRDFFLQTDLDANYQDATLQATAKLRNYSDQPVPARSLELELFDGSNHSVAKNQTTVPALNPGEEQAVALSLPVSNPAKWTAETPNLYTTVLKLDGGKENEILSAKTGFRKIEIKGRVFTINGQPVKLKGANRHENWPDTGHYVPEEKMIRDLELLKQGNCNHVRTCHYSDDPRWYELCDEYGIYLNAEANCECHGYYNVLDREPLYEKAIVDRSVANVENFKNHPAVVMWSLGNECGGGTNFVAARNAIKRLDTSRPVHYEPFGIGPNNPADVDSRMYTQPREVQQIAEDDRHTKPFYLCEFTHAMFNSMGSLAEYNALFDKYPALMGGAIWEWEDQGIWNRRDTNRQFLAFGGGFGEIPNDHYFIHKGVVFSDRSPKPHYPEMKRAFQWIDMQPDATATNVTIRNRYSFLNLDRFNGHWTLSEDGMVIDHGELPKLNLAPGQSQVVALKQKHFTPKPGAEYAVRVAFTLAQDEKWAKAGYEMAAQQFDYPVAVPAIAANAADMAALHIDDSADTIAIHGNGFAVSFNKAKGSMTELSRDGENLLLPDGGPALHLWRAPHRNDDMWADKSWQTYGLAHLQATVKSIGVTQPAPSVARVEALINLAGKSGFSVQHKAVYTIYGDGSLAVDNAINPQGRRIPLARLGVRLQLAKRLDHFAYFGRGPMENYSDRKTGSDVGFYTSLVSEQLTPYAKPMECGNHEDIRWAALAGKSLPTLMVQADNTNLQVSALPYTDEAMAPVEYSVDLPASASTVLTIAAKTLGVGSASCGPRPEDQYIVWSEPAVFSYALKLLPGKKVDLAGAARQAMPAGRARLAIPVAEKTAGPKGRIVAASSFEAAEGNPEHALDGDPTTFWHSRWSGTEARPPHFLVVDYGREINMAGFIYTARMDGDNGHIKDYEVYVSDDGQTWNTPVAKGRFDRDAEAETIHFAKAINARYLKFVALNEQNGRNFATIAELELIAAKP